jgi:protein gp37
MVFVNSMSDLFHKDVPFQFIVRVFEVMKTAKWHTFQVLTKRSERPVELSPELSWPENVWMGVSVENSDYLARIEHLKNTGARIKFISFEPLLGLIDGVVFAGIDWVIVGGESGPGARPVSPDWVTQIRDRCVSSKTPFFFKQWGGKNKKKAGRLLEGEIWSQIPRHNKRLYEPYNYKPVLT